MSNASNTRQAFAGGKINILYKIYSVTGAPIYLLDLFANASLPNVREKTSELMAKMLADKLVGPKVRIILSKFLPVIFMDAMRDSPEASVHMFEGAISCV